MANASQILDMVKAQSINQSINQSKIHTGDICEWTMKSLSNITPKIPSRFSWVCFGTGIAEQVSALDWLLLHCAAIITLRIRNPAYASHFTTLASSVDRDVHVGPVGRN